MRKRLVQLFKGKGGIDYPFFSGNLNGGIGYDSFLRRQVRIIPYIGMDNRLAFGLRLLQGNTGKKIG